MSQINLPELIENRESLLEAFLHVREVTELITSVLSPEDMLLSVTEDTSPPKWHLGHTSWFFEHFILQKFVADYAGNQDFEFLFNSYYKAVGAHIPKSKRGSISRPDVSEVLKYRQEVTAGVTTFLQSVAADQWSTVAGLIRVGINHEQQHQELLLMDIKRNFFENPLRPRFEGPELSSAPEVSAPNWQNVASGLVKIGKPNNSPEFGFDNEGDAHFHWIDSFMLSSHLVTNKEYLAFIDDGGYHNPLLWLSDGWEYKLKEGWQHPLYWERKDDSWWVMTLSGMMPLDLSAPVSHVSFYEAKAFAQWKGCRLPTEFEWETAASKAPVKGQFLESGHHEPRPANEDYQSFAQLHGTLWEWTQSAYLPYPRYESFNQGLAEYNEKFMCNQFVLRGGSCLTPQSHYRPSYRNFFYPHNRWQYSGIRLAKDLL